MTRATSNAEAVIKKYCFDSPDEIDPVAIAGAENILVETEVAKSYQGRIMFDEGYGLIKVNASITDENQKRFVVTHELGHYFNEAKGSSSCSKSDFLSYRSDKKKENDANFFTSELLMHEPWFQKFCKGRKPGSELLKNISEHFRVSLSAGAIRYSMIGKFATAVILSKDGKVQWSNCNEYFPFQFIKKGQSVNSYSFCDGFFKGDDLNTDINEVLADAWFLNDFKYKPETFLKEQNIHMPNYNSVLTILWE